MAARMLRLFGRFPLILAQGMASLYGIIGTLAAARVLPAEGFAAFAILTLVQGLTLGCYRSAIGDSSLILRRSQPQARPSLSQTLVCWAALAPVNALFVFRFSPDGNRASLILLSTVAPLLHDWLRYRAIADDRNWLVLVGDAVRLGGVVTVILTITKGAGLSASGIFGLLAVASIPAFLVLLAAQVRDLRRPRSSFALLWRISRWQLAEFAISQLHTSIPLLLLGYAQQSQVIGAFRLAQTMMGPINLVGMALSTNLLAATTRSADIREADVIAAGTRCARWTLVAAVAVSSAAIVLVLVVPQVFSSFSVGVLLLAVLCVASAATTAAFSSAHMTVLRVLLRQPVLARGRALKVAATWAGFSVGYLVGGVALSLAVGFLVAAASYPIFIDRPARRVYRELARPRD